MPANWNKLYVRGYRISPAWGVFTAGIAIAVLAWVIADSRVHDHATSQVDAAMNQAREAIRARIESSYDIVYGLQSFLNGSATVTRQDFHSYVSRLQLAERHPGIRSVVYAEYVPAEWKKAFESQVRQDKTMHVEEFAAFQVTPPGERVEYVPIFLIEPLRTNEKAIGLDLLTGERRESVERARESGLPVISGRVALVVDPLADAAFNVRLAVYSRDMPTSTPGERRAAFRGIVSATFVAGNLVRDILAQPALAPVAVKLYDRVAISGGDGLGAQRVEYILFEKQGYFAVAPSERWYFSRTVSLHLGGRDWQLEFAGSLDDFVTPTDRALPWILLFGGILVSALLAGLVSSLALSRERARRLAVRITNDLRRSEAKLAEAQQLTHAMIEALPNPIFYKSPEGRYIGVNKAWETFFGIPRESIVGKTVHDLYGAKAVELANGIHARDQELLQRQGALKYESAIATGDGVRHETVVYKATYCATNGEVAGLIGTIVDITERKRAETRQAMEHAVSRVLAEAQSMDLAIVRTLQTICETMGWDYGDRYEYSEELGTLRRQEMWAIDTPEMAAFASSAAHRTVKPDATGTGLVRRTFAARKPVWIADISREPGLQRHAFLERAGLHGAFAFPLIASGQVLGVLEFFHRDVREPDAMLIEVAQSIGSHIGQFIVRMQAEEAVKFVAMHDALTQLPNRVLFNQRLEQAIAQAQRHGRRLAVMFIDLDRFKVINDTLGHESGDQLLRDVTQRITENLRTGDMVARLGGDEFVVLLEDVDDASGIVAVAEKLIASLTASFVISAREVHVTASIGISTYPTDAEDQRSLLRFADIAMYRAKEQGRNTFQFYSDQINLHSVERLTLESQLRGALQREEFVVHYQPVIDTQTNAIVGLEALVRWNHPDAGLMAPAKFVSIAEETGLIVPIGEWVLETACAQQRKWRELGIPPLDIAVNLSPRQLVDHQLVQRVVRIVASTRCDASQLVFEITEGAVMHNASCAVALLTELKSMGIRIAIDDFGTGYSSLSYLKRFPIDCLKVDRSFIGDIPGDAGNTAITQAIIAMARSLDVKVIAEGVESREQLAFLREHQCDAVQGYFFSAALPAAEATALLQNCYKSNVRRLEPGRRINRS
jgi:diguanylate cyclase (GGDEF)-like protein/PAS domain S-box-containing protein